MLTNERRHLFVGIVLGGHVDHTRQPGPVEEIRPRRRTVFLINKPLQFRVEHSVHENSGKSQKCLKKATGKPRV
jgi:hypothetical protein